MRKSSAAVILIAVTALGLVVFHLSAPKKMDGGSDQKEISAQQLAGDPNRRPNLHPADSSTRTPDRSGASRQASNERPLETGHEAPVTMAGDPKPPSLEKSTPRAVEPAYSRELPSYLARLAVPAGVDREGCELPQTMLWRMGQEEVDPTWSEEVGSALRDTWESLGNDRFDPALSVQCRATVCEMSLLAPPGGIVSTGHAAAFGRVFKEFSDHPAAEQLTSPRSLVHGRARDGSAIQLLMFRRIGTGPTGEPAVCTSRQENR